MGEVQFSGSIHVTLNLSIWNQLKSDWLYLNPGYLFQEKNQTQHFFRKTRVPVLSEAGKWRNITSYSKCKICDWLLLDDLNSVQKKLNLCSRWAQLKLFTLTCMPSGAFAYSSAIFVCKITVNTCRHFLFKSLNLWTVRRRSIFLYNFSTTSFGFSVVTVPRLCWFTGTEEWTWCAFQKKSTDFFLKM